MKSYSNIAESALFSGSQMQYAIELAREHSRTDPLLSYIWYQYAKPLAEIEKRVDSYIESHCDREEIIARIHNQEEQALTLLSKANEACQIAKKEVVELGGQPLLDKARSFVSVIQKGSELKILLLSPREAKRLRRQHAADLNRTIHEIDEKIAAFVAASPKVTEKKSEIAAAMDRAVRARDYKEAKPNYLRAAGLGHKGALYQLACAAQKADQMDEAHYLHMVAAVQGHPISCLWLANYYFQKKKAGEDKLGTPVVISHSEEMKVTKEITNSKICETQWLKLFVEKFEAQRIRQDCLG